jgi:hypothetical protein
MSQEHKFVVANCHRVGDDGGLSVDDALRPLAALHEASERDRVAWVFQMLGLLASHGTIVHEAAHPGRRRPSDQINRPH